MKRFITILVFISIAFLVNAQHRIQPAVEITRNTYEEVIDLINMMERVSVVEKLEGIKLDANHLTTRIGEFMLVRDVNSINITHTEFTKMLNDHIAHPNRRWYDMKAIKTELLIHNVKLFEYMSERLSGNHHIKSMHIEVEPKSGASYIRINYHRL